MGDPDGDTSGVMAATPTVADTSTSAKRQTFFGMYSGAKGQEKTTESLKTRASRASGKLSKMNGGGEGGGGGGGALRDSSKNAAGGRRMTDMKGELRDQLAQAASKSGYKPVNYDDDLDDLFEEDEEGDDEDDDEVRMMESELPAMAEEDMTKQIHSKITKEAERKRKETLMQRKEVLSGVNPKDFESVKEGLHSAPDAKGRSRMRTQLLTEKFNGKSKGDKKTLGLRKVVKMTGNRQSKATAYLCGDKDAAFTKDKNRQNRENKRRTVAKKQAKTYAEFDATRKKKEVR
eukprot:CAMPEP_0118650608 /NCGR_PEP_ID=MMETSP0785-20121206/10336_1 /TAXON_ID=91992 /ORGANISM="Bolidomonas pacifica, Strain CCMP 1866" /LENGTH=289 /DNA_ID=CAMNT_0006542991 /DNA_START=93 /DNA_END=959 /DNA_ORIENTATION=+